jgi:uncharacterized protein (DUF433 family)
MHPKLADMIIEDPEVQAGAPTFRGTRVLARPIAEAIRRGVSRDEIKADYRLTDQQIEAALAYPLTPSPHGG